MYTIILANSTAEAIGYVKSVGLRPREYRYAAKASTIRNLRIAKVVELPGFKKRFDRHAILAALRWAKVPEWEVVDEVKPDRRLSLERAQEVAFRYQAIQRINDEEPWYDKGGILPPELTQVVNSGSKPEPVWFGVVQ